MALGYSITAVDIHDGSELAVGYASLSQERGVRRFFVETTGADAEEWHSGTKKGAIDAVFAAHSTHPEISTLPLQFARATKIGPRKFIVDQYWAWGSNSSWGGNSANTLADFDIGVALVPCFTCGTPESDGLPSATVGGGTTLHRCVDLNDIQNTPCSYMYEMAEMRLRIPFQSNVSPMPSAIEALVGKVSSEQLQILASAATDSTMNLAANTLRFMGVRVTSRVNASYAFVGYREFVARRSWKQQNVSRTTSAWVIDKTAFVSYSSGFASAFGFGTWS